MDGDLQEFQASIPRRRSTSRPRSPHRSRSSVNLAVRGPCWTGRQAPPPVPVCSRGRGKADDVHAEESVVWTPGRVAELFLATLHVPLASLELPLSVSLALGSSQVLIVPLAPYKSRRSLNGVIQGSVHDDRSTSCG